MNLPIVLVAAVANNGVIGRDGGLPWRLPGDLKRFKADTMGRPIIMGRKTWQGIGRPLPGRANIIVTGDPAFSAQGASVVHGIDEALHVAEQQAGSLDPGDAICVIGGGELYALTMARADRLVITHVNADVDGDTYFPDIDPEQWIAIHEEALLRGDKDSHDARHVVYERKTAH